MKRKKGEGRHYSLSFTHALVTASRRGQGGAGKKGGGAGGRKLDSKPPGVCGAGRNILGILYREGQIGLFVESLLSCGGGGETRRERNGHLPRVTSKGRDKPPSPRGGGGEKPSSHSAAADAAASSSNSQEFSFSTHYSLTHTQKKTRAMAEKAAAVSRAKGRKSCLAFTTPPLFLSVLRRREED